MIPGHVTHQSTCLRGNSQQESHRRHTGTTPTVKVPPRHLVLLLPSEEATQVSHERVNFDKPVASYPGPAHFTNWKRQKARWGLGMRLTNGFSFVENPMHLLLLLSTSLTLKLIVGVM